MENISLPQSFKATPNFHAYLYVSADFSQRHSAAIHMAMSILCDNKKDDLEPCGNCHSCKMAMSGAHPDIIFVSGTEKTSVDDVRKIDTEAYLAPNEAQYKVFILENADEYNVQSQNALLKIIEEPPKSVKFILTASSPFSILPTVKSRVCTISGKQKSKEQYTSDIKKQLTGLSDEKAIALASFCLHYDKTDINAVDTTAFFEYMQKATDFLSAKDKNAIMTLPKKREELMVCLQVFMLCLWQISVTKITGKISEDFIKGDALSAIATKLSLKKALALYDIFEESYLQLFSYANVNAALSYIWQNTK